jgi:hypothetical protein
MRQINEANPIGFGFIDENGGGPGVRLRERLRPKRACSTCVGIVADNCRNEPNRWRPIPRCKQRQSRRAMQLEHRSPR